ncbi:MAG: GNAT family N-acetyltransferase [Acidobacteriota bacterium]
MTGDARRVVVVNTRPEHFAGIRDLTGSVYAGSPPWSEAQLASHVNVFPEGQFVAVDAATSEVVGMAASLIVWWDDYDVTGTWRDFTANGFFTNHDPAKGRTLYGAEVMTHPRWRGRGIGKLLYRARRDLVEQLRLLRIRAGARLRGYHRYADQMAADDYVVAVIRGEITDPTLTFQLRQGFHVLAVVPGYLRHDPESQGWAAVIEWINEKVATPADYGHGDPKFDIQLPPPGARGG